MRPGARSRRDPLHRHFRKSWPILDQRASRRSEVHRSTLHLAHLASLILLFRHSRALPVQLDNRATPKPKNARPDPPWLYEAASLATRSPARNRPTRQARYSIAKELRADSQRDRVHPLIRTRTVAQASSAGRITPQLPYEIAPKISRLTPASVARTDSRHTHPNTQ